ncbi:DUF1127 domain-containing protein [Rhodospirillaceae bacterium SYSU D60014]|uniref:DUF1127 domain-containing protein n=1 Tax=Virgifigura deserti TaxID=2268457 RepID=UPI000E676654
MRSRFSAPFIEPRPWFAKRRCAAASKPHSSTHVPSTIARRAIDLVLAWRENARQRRVLAALDERMLKDIGLNRLEVVREVRKPFWRS